MVVPIQQSSQRSREPLAVRRIRVFEQQYGSDALNLACHAAFPLTLTTDVVYCLRENFVSQCPWYAAADVLLSSLCRSVGHDLYEMDGETRNALLNRLCECFGEKRLYQLEEFMIAYIQHRLGVESSDRPRLLGDRSRWTVLACLRPGEAMEAIQQELRRLSADGEPQDRFRLAALVESYADLLAQTNFQPILLDWAERTADGRPIDDVAAAAVAAATAGFPLKVLTFTKITFVFEEDETEEDSSELLSFEFETPIVDNRGQVIRVVPEQAFYFVESLGDAVPPLEMVAIPGGRFQMGSPPDEPKRYKDEGPQHAVTVPPFFISKYLVTQVQWRTVAALSSVERSLEVDPSYAKGDQQPVEQVSWEEAVEFCHRLSRYTGRDYWLPTEAEWEYACRAETTTPFHFGETLTSELANYDSEVAYQNGPTSKRLGHTTSVGHFPPNPFGLCDMHGNVWEWCLDYWHENYEEAPTDGSAWLFSNESQERVVRGGSWSNSPGYCRSASRISDYPDFSDGFIGFRVVCAVRGTP
ncbi:MAG: formylglycine-generating enzyme family protein [Cyanothece sp. SIO1E1]|nr:formylglycine-generating enzyme family protein [Cyanothece sp. SIO1E1]